MNDQFVVYAANDSFLTVLRDLLVNGEAGGTMDTFELDVGS